MRGKVLFLDLDGTVRHGPINAASGMEGFIYGPEDVELYDDVLDILRSYKAAGWRIAAISNQGGIAMGHTTVNNVSRAMMETNRLCANLFDQMQWCSHHPDAADKNSRLCLCRKPNIGMVISTLMTLGKKYEEDYPLDQCLFVGDREEDEQCAKSCHIPFVWADRWRQKGPLNDPK